MQCNIDARGKAVRLVMGGITALVGLVLVIAIVLDAIRGPWAWGFAVAALVFGAVGVFEGAVGWCAIRAMGFRTRL